jgi:hypothetical protein
MGNSRSDLATNWANDRVPDPDSGGDRLISNDEVYDLAVDAFLAGWDAATRLIGGASKHGRRTDSAKVLFRASELAN